MWLGEVSSFDNLAPVFSLMIVMVMVMVVMLTVMMMMTMTAFLYFVSILIAYHRLKYKHSINISDTDSDTEFPTKSQISRDVFGKLNKALDDAIDEMEDGLFGLDDIETDEAIFAGLSGGKDSLTCQEFTNWDDIQFLIDSVSQ